MGRDSLGALSRRAPEPVRSMPPLLPWQLCLLAYAAGILAVAHVLAGLAGLGLLALFPRPAPGRPPRLALAAVFGLGFAVSWWAMPPPPAAVPAALASRRAVSLTGRVVAVASRPDDRLGVTLAAVDWSDGAGQAAGKLPGRLALTIDGPDFWPVPGDRLAVTARLRPTRGFTNPGGPDFAFTRRLENVFYRAYARGGREQVTRLAPGPDGPARWREDLRRAVVARLAPPPDADRADKAGRAMVPALLFGDRSGLTTADVDLVRRASLAHTLALSGMHVGFVAALGAALVLGLTRLFPGLCLRVPRARLVVLVAGPLVAGYCFLGGATPSLVRAALMFAAFGCLLWLRRDRIVLDGLFLALAGILLVSPLAAYDVRLQLSALAVAGIAALWRLPGALFPGLSLPRPLRGALLWVGGTLWVSVCAEAAVLPVISRLYGDIGPGLWINLLWLPVLGGLAMPLALAGLVVTAVPGLGGLGAALLVGAADCCAGLMRLLSWLAAHDLLPTRAVLRPSWPEALGCLGLFAALAVVVAGGRRPVAVMAACLALLVGPTIWRAATDLDDAVTLTVLDVGQGQAVAVALPGGRRLLVDAGGLSGDFDVGRAVVGAFLTDGRPPRLTAALASHPHRDHIKGFFSLLSRFAVDAYYDNGGRPEGALAVPLDRAVAACGAPRRVLAAGDRLELGHGLVLDVLHPGPGDDLSGNDGSLVLRLTRNGRGLAVIPGDAERGVLTRLADLGAALGAQVLVLPHHGSASSLSPRFLRAVSPRLAIASCGDVWRFPAARVRRALEWLGCAIRDTSHDGAVTVRFVAGRLAGVTTAVGGRDDTESEFASRDGKR